MSAFTLAESEELYVESKNIFLDHLAKFDDWEDYRERHLHTEEAKYSKKYIIEKLIRKMRKLVYDEYFDKYPFFRKFSPQYKKQHAEFLDTLDYHNFYDPIKIESTKGGRRLSLTTYNIHESELFYPNIKIVYNCHSADHSIIPVLMYKDHPTFKNHQVIFYQHPLTTHPGDREYVTYYAAKLDVPFMIGMRLENLAYLLQINGVPQMQHFNRRYCTRIYKQEVAEEVYKKYFWPWQYKLTKKELLAYCDRYGICKGKRSLRRDDLVQHISKMIKINDLKPPNNTNYIRDDTPFPFHRWDYKKQKWVKTDKESYIFPIYNMTIKEGETERLLKIGGKYKMKTVIRQLANFEKTGMKLMAKNIVQFLGIAAYQSLNRAKMNPNITLAQASNKNQRFYVYQYFPIHALPYSELAQMILDSGLVENPYNLEYEINAAPTGERREKEIRFGCIWCPYKTGDYYAHLKDNFPIAYYFCHLMRTIASARSLFGETWPDDFGEEYYWWDEDHVPAKHPEWAYIM